MESSQSPQTYSAFFYGTLLHPKVLKRVINNNGDHLKIAPAVLNGYRRHEVSGAHFPAIIRADLSHETFNTPPDPTNDRVQGSYVSGLTTKDVARLDRFESNLYTRELVEVQLLDEPVDLNEVDPNKLIDTNASREPASQPKATSAQTYVWSQPLSELEPNAWSFEEFVRDKLAYWAWEAPADLQNG